MKKKQYTAPCIKAIHIFTDSLLQVTSYGVYVNDDSYVDINEEGL